MLGIQSQHTAGQHTPQTVYNLEVQGQHVFRVTSNGLLVHNDCPTRTGYGAFGWGKAPHSQRTLTHRNGIYEALSEQPITGTTRGAHRASANRALLRQLDADPRLNRQLSDLLKVDDLAAQMRSGRGRSPLNPSGTEWHHPIHNPDVMQLLRREVHRHGELQDILHPGPNGTGGYGTNYGRGN